MKRKMVFAWFMILALACFVAANSQAATFTFDFLNVGTGVGNPPPVQVYMQSVFGSTNLGTTDLKADSNSSLFGSDAIQVSPGTLGAGVIDFDTLAAGASTYKILSVSFKWGVYTASTGDDFGLDVYNDFSNTWILNYYTTNLGTNSTGQTGVLLFDNALEVTALRIHDAGNKDVGMDDLTIVDNRIVPEPGTLLLLGSGLLGLVLVGSRKKSRK